MEAGYVQVFIRLYASLQRFAPAGIQLGESFPLTLTQATIKEIISLIGIPEIEASIVLVNGIRVQDMDSKVNHDDLIVIFPPLGGG